MSPRERLTRSLCVQQQRGMAVLAMTVGLLAAAALAALYQHRSELIERATAHHVLRTAQAREAAEAGVEWATSLLNTAQGLDETCQPSSGPAATFRERYVLPRAQTPPRVAPTSAQPPVCQLNESGGHACHCPVVAGAGSVAQPSAAPLPGFTVTFSAVPLNPSQPGGPADPLAVRVTATGCSPWAGFCTPTTVAGPGGPQAVVAVSVILKFRPVLHAAPAASLTCGRDCEPSGITLVNTDADTHGTLVHAGGLITADLGAYGVTVPGQPPQWARAAGDAWLRRRAPADGDCGQTSVFPSYVGITLADYVAKPTTRSLPGCQVPGACRDPLLKALEAGWRQFYFPDGVSLDDSGGPLVLGSPDEPVLLVSPSTFSLRGGLRVNGLLVSTDADGHAMQATSSGQPTVIGAVLACRDFAARGPATLVYSPTVMSALLQRPGQAIRLPGSWTDACRWGGTPSASWACS